MVDVKLISWKSKIVGVGKYSLFLRLPLDYCRSHELQSGTPVEIAMLSDGTIRVIPEGPQ